MSVHIPHKKIKPISSRRQVLSLADSFPWAQLQNSVAQQNRTAFQMLVQGIDWTKRTPQELLQTIRWALALDAPLLARRLSEQGVKRYPENDELQEVARLLSPPTATVSQPITAPNLNANQEWLLINRDSYQGQWVALKDGVLLAAAASFPALLNDVGDIKSKGILATKVV